MRCGRCDAIGVLTGIRWTDARGRERFVRLCHDCIAELRAAMALFPAVPK